MIYTGKKKGFPGNGGGAGESSFPKKQRPGEAKYGDAGGGGPCGGGRGEGVVGGAADGSRGVAFQGRSI